MKKIITAFVFCFLCGECFSQAGEWVWVKGDSVPNQPGNFGVQGVPSPTNNPPSLYEPCEWTDLNGNFWLFGGLDHNLDTYNDLWKYDPLTNDWTWIKGTGMVNNPGNYGVQGVPSLSNNPPARGYGMMAWTDNTGNLWMFGGSHAPSPYRFNDLWKYDIVTNEWTWMKGFNQTGQLGIYGTQGIADPANTPGCRDEMATAWTDNAGDLWLFGGAYYGSAWHSFNDLWRFDISTNNWTWMKGSQNTNQPGVYGTKGVEDAANTPGARWAYSHWKDFNGNFWLFGGTALSQYYHNDLWRYNPTTNNWTWMNGDSASNTFGDYGLKCLSANLNNLSSRYENRASWKDPPGNFWIFGGRTINGSIPLNDLWVYCFATNQWTWASGDSANSSGSWGTIGVSSPFNVPNGRFGSTGWSDQNGHLYLFGGNDFNNYNDLWKYTIDTSCGVCPAPNSIQENNFTNELLVFPNPTNSSLTISFQSSENQTIELRIYNTLGKQIYFSKEEITKGKFEKEINVKKLGDGIYFLQLKTEDGNMSRKIMISHP